MQLPAVCAMQRPYAQPAQPVLPQHAQQQASQQQAQQQPLPHQPYRFKALRPAQIQQQAAEAARQQEQQPPLLPFEPYQMNPPPLPPPQVHASWQPQPPDGQHGTCTEPQWPAGEQAQPLREVRQQAHAQVWRQRQQRYDEKQAAAEAQRSAEEERRCAIVPLPPSLLTSLTATDRAAPFGSTGARGACSVGDAGDGDFFLIGWRAAQEAAGGRASGQAQARGHGAAADPHGQPGGGLWVRSSLPYMLHRLDLHALPLMLPSSRLHPCILSGFVMTHPLMARPMQMVQSSCSSISAVATHPQ